MAEVAEIVKKSDPWMLSKEAFDAIDGLIKPGDTILELGSGVGTGVLVKKYVVWSIEHDTYFMSLLGSEKHDLEHHMIYAPLENGWYDRAIVNAQIPTNYDLLIVDGPVGSENRIKFLQNFDLFRVDVPILIDDVHRPLEMDMATALAVNIPYDMEVVETKANSSFAVLRPV